MSNSIKYDIKAAREIASKAFMIEWNNNVVPKIEQFLKSNNYSSVDFGMGGYTLKRDGDVVKLPAKTHVEFMDEINKVITYDQLFEGTMEFFPSDK